MEEEHKEVEQAAVAQQQSFDEYVLLTAAEVEQLGATELQHLPDYEKEDIKNDPAKKAAAAKAIARAERLFEQEQAAVARQRQAEEARRQEQLRQQHQQDLQLQQQQQAAAAASSHPSSSFSASPREFKVGDADEGKLSLKDNKSRKAPKARSLEETQEESRDSRVYTTEELRAKKREEKKNIIRQKAAQAAAQRKAAQQQQQQQQQPGMSSLAAAASVTPLPSSSPRELLLQQDQSVWAVTAQQTGGPQFDFGQNYLDRPFEDEDDAQSELTDESQWWNDTNNSTN